MINYFIDLFKKPKYLWTTLDDWAVIGLIFVVCIILFLFYVISWFIVDWLKKCKFKKYEGKRNFDKCWHHEDCLNCRYYKKKSKKVDEKSE